MAKRFRVTLQADRWPSQVRDRNNKNKPYGLTNKLTSQKIKIRTQRLEGTKIS